MKREKPSKALVFLRSRFNECWLAHYEKYKSHSEYDSELRIYTTAAAVVNKTFYAPP